MIANDRENEKIRQPSFLLREPLISASVGVSGEGSLLFD